jgi:putative FmdB family regulatory protein
MPTYCYQAKDEKESCTLCKEGFEIKQSMKDESLKKCPECGAAIERIITSVGIKTSPSGKSLLSDRNLKKHGFSKLVRDKGGYRKVV